MKRDDVEIHVYTEREGLMSPVGHDLKLRAEEVEVTVEGDDVTVRVGADSMRVDACIVDGREESVGRRDARKIERNAARDVLRAHDHPHVVYEGTIDRSDDTLTVEGVLTIRGRSNSLTLEFRRDGESWTSETTLQQSEWGIEPYTAFFGALRLKDVLRVEIRFDE